MKEHVYPEDVKAIPIKLLSAKQQQPFVDLAKERHEIWSRIIDLEERGFDKSGRLPVWDVVSEFRKAHSTVRFWRLVHAATSDVFALDEAYWQTPLQGLKAKGPAFVLKRAAVGTVGPAVKKDRDGVAAVLAKLLSALPATYAERENVDEVPKTTDGLLALGRFLEERAKAVPTLYGRIEAINQEIDRRAWRLYAPRVPPDADSDGREE